MARQVYLDLTDAERKQYKKTTDIAVIAVIVGTKMFLMLATSYIRKEIIWKLYT